MSCFNCASVWRWPISAWRIASSRSVVSSSASTCPAWTRSPALTATLATVPAPWKLRFASRSGSTEPVALTVDEISPRPTVTVS